MKTVKFNSYDGKWPNLCSGTLSFDIEDLDDPDWEPITIRLKDCLVSSGSCYFKGDYDEAVTEQGPWEVDLNDYVDSDEISPKLLLNLKPQIVKMVNENVSFGCCGGCH